MRVREWMTAQPVTVTPLMQAAGDAESPDGSDAPVATLSAVRPEVTVNVVLTEFAIEADVDEIPAWATVTLDERIRAWVVNNGPSVDSSVHVVGTIFDTVVKEGVALHPNNPGAGAAKPSTSHPPREATSSSPSPKTAVPHRDPTPSTTSDSVRSACSKPATAAIRLPAGTERDPVR